jgi:tRNA nucleotidyltransferase (CCA-adding enzyme)
MPAVLDRVMELQARTYQFKNQNETNKTSTGFIAQEVMPLFPELVEDFKYPTKDTTDNNIYHGINYAGFSVIAIKAIQEQQTEIDLLKDQNKMMMGEIINLQAAIETLKQKIK